MSRLTTFVISLALLAGVAFMIVASRNLGSMFGTPTYPVTYQVIELVGGTFGLFMLIIITFYSGELVWRERDTGVHEIVDALPIPHRKPKKAVKEEVQDEVERAQFLAKAVEPHSTQSGFLFFDVSGIRNPLAGANLYVSGIRNSKGEEMIYFEIPMEKYLSYTPPR